MGSRSRAVTRGPRYRPVMTDAEVLKLLRAGVYRVNLETGVVYGPTDKALAAEPRGRGEYLFVRLYAVIRGVPKAKAIAVQRLVWMAATGEVIPPGFEVHHEDEETQSNAFSNLLCLHKLDHRKKHRHRVESDEPIPF